jgi:hypothetical protein
VFATIDHAPVAVILASVVALVVAETTKLVLLAAFAGAPVNVAVGVSLLG